MKRIATIVAASACLSLLALSAPVQAAPPSFPPGSTLRFKRLGIENGLAQSSVQAIVQDPQGYMWLGTEDGLQRYDGYDFTTYRHDPADPGSLADNAVNALTVQPDGTLWIATQEVGLDRFDPGSSHFVHYQHNPTDPRSLADNQVYTLLQDRAHQLWVGTAQGLDLLQKDGGFRHYHVPTPAANSDEVRSLYQADDGRLWIGTTHGLYYLDPAQAHLQAFTPTTPITSAELAGVFNESPVHVLHGAADGGLWIGCGRGLVLLDKHGGVQRFFQHQPGDAGSLVNDHVFAILQDADGSLWLGTLGGLSHYDPTQQRFSSNIHDATDPGSLSVDDIYTLYRDAQGLLWIGTGSGGVDIYNPATRVFGFYRHRQGDPNSLAANLVWDVYKDARGELWVATDAGITRMDVSREHYRQYKLGERPANHRDDELVNAIYGDKHGGIWAGSDYGLYRYLPTTDGFKRYALTVGGEDSNGDVVTDVLDDSRDRLWVSTGAGLVLFDAASGGVRRFLHDPLRADSLPDDAVQALCETPDGHIWVATANGLGSFDGTHDRFHIYRQDAKDPQSLSFDNVQFCHADAAGGLWAGTASGLDYLDPKTGKFRRYFVADGLPTNNVYTVLPDTNGGIWISTDNGLARLDAASGTIRVYSVSDGLQSDEFNGGAAFAASDGELFFGGINGLTSFRPADLARSPHAPDVAITRFMKQGIAVPLITPAGPVAHVDVNYRQNFLNFEFTAFDYQAPESDSFSYKLEGFDADWHTLRGRHQATYTNLDPGEYLLRVRGTNADGNWSGAETTLAIRVLPPPWRSWWAWLLYAAGSFVALMFGLGLYKRNITREHSLEYEQLRRRWAESLHHLVQSVTGLRDERVIAEELLETLMHFVPYEQALFYQGREGALRLIAARGLDAGGQDFLEHWPARNPRIVARLKLAIKPLTLTPEDAASLAAHPGRPAQHFLAVPVNAGSGTFRLLLVGRPFKSIDAQQMEIAGLMAKQVSVALDNAALIDELENLATTDSLTRLYNRRYFMERAEAEFERSLRYKRELSVFLMDADHFKAINDGHGHETGDKALRLLGMACRQSLRHLDIVGRYGGEEFVVLLPETSAALAHEAAERLRRAVAELQVPSESGDVRMTVSIGVATADASTESVAALINAADRALYEAKRSGRNRVAAAGNGRAHH